LQSVLDEGLKLMSGASECYTATDNSVCKGSPLLNTGNEMLHMMAT
jgi:hypothetical protein